MTQACPGGHGTQSSSLVIDRLSAAIVMFWWRPDGHGSGAAEPSLQYDPALHVSHAVWPSLSWYLPAMQLSQVPLLALGCTVPGLHSTRSSEPVEQNDP